MVTSPLISLALAAGVSASALPRASNNGFLTMAIAHETRQEPHIMRRDNTVTLYNRSTIAYMVELNIGTPPQTVRVQLDTGSDELWVDPDCTQVSNQKSAEFCDSLGFYDTSKSSTVVDQEVTKTLHYGIGSAKIQYVSDNIAIPGSNGKTLTDVIFGVATASKDAAVPIMGVGYGKGVNLQYSNIVDQMLDQGIINTKAFSVALGPSSQNNGGLVIFGGLDTKKYSGKLVTLPNLPPQAGENGLARYWVQLDSVGFTKSSGGSNTYSNSKTPIVIDSGSSYSYLPSSVITKLASDFGGQMDSDGNTEVPCSVLNQAGSVDFTFGAITIKVPYKEFIRQLDANTCIMGAMAADDTPLLGDTFMRSAYVVFDQTNKQISMAPYVNCGTAEQTLPTGAGAVANIQGQCDGNAKPNSASGGPAKNIWMAVVGLVSMQLLMALF